MKLAAKIFTALVMVEHVYILIMEMFLWNTPYGQKNFNLTPEYAASTVVLAANQGLYNGFLAAGLAWSFLTQDAAFSHAIKVFFLGCIVVAGIYGGYSAMIGILYKQALPAAIALALVLLSKKE